MPFSVAFSIHSQKNAPFLLFFYVYVEVAAQIHSQFISMSSTVLSCVAIFWDTFQGDVLKRGREGGVK